MYLFTICTYLVSRSIKLHFLIGWHIRSSGSLVPSFPVSLYNFFSQPLKQDVAAQTNKGKAILSLVCTCFLKLTNFKDKKNVNEKRQINLNKENKRRKKEKRCNSDSEEREDLEKKSPKVKTPSLLNHVTLIFPCSLLYLKKKREIQTACVFVFMK